MEAKQKTPSANQSWRCYGGAAFRRQSGAVNLNPWYAGSNDMDVIIILLMVAQLAVAIYVAWKSSKKS
jgi:hypothetical protein